MVPWNQAYERIIDSEDFRLQFGRLFAKDEFRYYAYCMKFENVPPALLSDGTTINTRSYATTRTGAAAPTTNLVPGPPVNLDINFPAGAVLLGYSGCMSMPQRVQAFSGGNADFTYSPWGDSAGKRGNFIVSVKRGDGEPIMGSNPIDEALFPNNGNTPFRSIPFGLADAAIGDGVDSDEPVDALIITPGNTLSVTVQSMAIPADVATADLTQPSPSQTIHLVFHCMIPGTVTKST